MGTGHAVVVAALREYSGKLDGDVAVPKEVSGLVDQSDVGDKSWGVVGLFVKEKYTDMLGDLKDLLTEMGAGLQAASQKFGSAANAYEQHEDDSKQLLGEILNVLQAPAPNRTPTMGPAPEGN
ncbi:ESX-1 secretion-associated protein [Amycolatopsis acidicola]|uniref:ESX-1 secretion-associated protein n=1 Tax=Amycolatopsis acidicola TaxID=2596893 RepID=A0A5N0V953_9PSEU|nr:ESX-1 secretion-associated protein [Amycolatopsis acidicola]KAA9162929.1 ESX-1 secretion-associated protein [Amycolatopsis acidicola]